MKSLTLDAYAKLNLGLRVLGLRADGYHDISSEFRTIDLADRLTLSKTPDADDRVEMTLDHGIEPHDNLVDRAISLVQERVGRRSGVWARIEKRIPMGAGLGGGSSDAAATLVGLNRLWDLGLSHGDLHTLALELGSDVPFFLQGGRRRVGGRGEWSESLDDGTSMGDASFVLLVPPWSLCTTEVYRTFDRLDPATMVKSPFPNDLEAAALRLEPRLTVYREWLQSADVAFGLSGSGPVYFALADSDDEAGRIAEAADRALHGEVLICHPTPCGQRLSNGGSLTSS